MRGSGVHGENPQTQRPQPEPSCCEAKLTTIGPLCCHPVRLTVSPDHSIQQVHPLPKNSSAVATKQNNNLCFLSSSNLNSSLSVSGEFFCPSPFAPWQTVNTPSSDGSFCLSIFRDRIYMCMFRGRLLKEHLVKVWLHNIISICSGFYAYIDF